MRTVSLEDVSITYSQRGAKVHAVRGVSLSVSEGETLAVVGESGSGKSSTARVLAGLQKPTAGKVVWSDDTAARPAPKTGYPADDDPRVQMVFQHPDQSLDPMWSVARSLAEPLVRLGYMSRLEIRAQGADFLERVGLDREYLTRYPRDLSGGQAQRVCIARALVSKPHIVVLDEPTASLDQTIRTRLIGTLAELQQETGVGYLLVSHDIGSVRRLADRIVVMYLGQIIEEGTAAQVLDAPRHPYTRALIDAVPPSDPRAVWDPSSFSIDRTLSVGRSVADLPCPVPGPSCDEHQIGLNEIATGHRVACSRAAA
ncbi:MULTISPECIES: ATP-binding cassette domain-containing protein [unclassified Microbacterium]|uniref:ABC transporter ATP-binding protein n=1 Tax=unclassified Microbacterium TaxID=2609290 RepID=UPI00214C09EC|nr:MULTISPECIES: ATP-binding cassette domain-containing protein [unclassified Microbacterium]MCR2810636.1 ATP-binding cassette domain-containing protein [Microbacterium sp. zg.B185]WIM18173.1 ATP-binding cassette domain-containing protein [Microbacterium sp. zg-B185]